MTGEAVGRVLDYLAEDQLGFQYVANIARFAHVTPAEADAALHGLAAKGYVDSMGDDQRRGWQITKAGVEWAGASS